MPEGPEVEVQRELLSRVLPCDVGVSRFELDLKGFRRHADLSVLPVDMTNVGSQEIPANSWVIGRAERAGKKLLLGPSAVDLGDPFGPILTVSLGLWGQFFVDAPASDDDRMVLHLSNGHVIRYKDRRSWGLLHTSPHWFSAFARLYDNGMGPDLLYGANCGEDNAIRWDRLRLESRAVGEWLLDQSVFTSVGNIYRAEICHAVGIDPRRSINYGEYLNVIAAAQVILAFAVSRGGSSVSDFVGGSNQDHLKVYSKTHCGTCGSPVTRDTLSDRTIFYCDHCQR